MKKIYLGIVGLLLIVIMAGVVSAQDYCVDDAQCHVDICKADSCTNLSVEEQNAIADWDTCEYPQMDSEKCKCVVNQCIYQAEQNGDEDCEDSDGGLNYYVQGHLQNMCAPGSLCGIWADQCLNEKTLLEYTCNDLNGVEINCSVGCENGACIPAGGPNPSIVCGDMKCEEHEGPDNCPIDCICGDWDCVGVYYDENLEECVCPPFDDLIPGEDYIAGELLVGFKDNIAEETARNLIEDLGLEIERVDVASWRLGDGMFVIKVQEGEEKQWIEILENEELIDNAELNAVLTIEDGEQETKEKSNFIYWIIGIIAVIIIIILFFKFRN